MTLRNKLRTLTAPSRDVDAEIAVMFGWQKIDLPFTNINGATEVTIMWLPPDCDDEDRGETERAIRIDCALKGYSNWGHHPRFTKSLDAIVDLVEREMPGCFWAVNAMDRQNNRYIAEVGDKLDDAGAEHSLRAVALLLALLEAKEIGDE